MNIPYDIMKVNPDINFEIKVHIFSLIFSIMKDLFS